MFFIKRLFKFDLLVFITFNCYVIDRIRQFLNLRYTQSISQIGIQQPNEKISLCRPQKQTAQKYFPFPPSFPHLPKPPFLFRPFIPAQERGQGGRVGMKLSQVDFESHKFGFVQKDVEPGQVDRCLLPFLPQCPVAHYNFLGPHFFRFFLVTGDGRHLFSSSHRQGLSFWMRPSVANSNKLQFGVTYH